MEFESTGKRYYCPLAEFQPRTQNAEAFAAESYGVEEKPARNTVAV
jgi:hypothetical protein